MRRLVVGTAGHIDHGKSTLVHALTGIDPDRLKEEKARGITIELGFAHATIGGARVAFVDVPGHERFVRTMLAGVGGIDCVMLVVAADESVMPQTREHFDICRLLGVPAGLVVITKADLADEDTRALVALEVGELVAGSFLDGAPVIEVSARTGAGLDVLRQAIEVAAEKVPARPVHGAVRLPIDRAFSMRGFGTVVTGTLVSGQLTVGQDLTVLPSRLPVKVRGLQVHGHAEASGAAGQRIAVNLAGVDVAAVPRGATLAEPGSLAVTRRAEVALDLLRGARPLRQGARVRVHQGTAEVLARVSLAGPERLEVQPGDSALARVRFENPAVLTRGDRVILRAYSPPVTIGAATVLDPLPRVPGIRSSAAYARLERLRDSDTADVLATMIDERGLTGLDLSDAVVRLGVGRAALDVLVGELVRQGRVARAGERLVDLPALERGAAALGRLVQSTHRDDPLSEGLPRAEARARLFGAVDSAVFEAAVARLVGRGELVDRERLAAPTHRVGVEGPEAEAQAKVEEAYRRGGLTPPDAAALAAQAGVPTDVAARVTTLLLRQKTLVKVDTLLVHREALEQLKRDMAALKPAAGGEVVRIDVASFKDRYGMSRKFAIPLLEYLDRERVTRRTGDARVLL
jgi:selenocysteine-specific elongation factor